MATFTLGIVCLLIVAAAATSKFRSYERSPGNDMTTVLENLVMILEDKMFDGISFFEDDDILRNVIDTVDNSTDSPQCVTCKAAVTVLKTIASTYTWAELRDPLVSLCLVIAETFTNNTGEYVNGETRCPGTVDLQGPHIYEILQPKYRKSPEEHCEFLNLCFPPPYDTNLTQITKPQLTFEQTSILAEDFQQRKRAAIKIIQLSDIHIQPLYGEGTSTDCGLPVCCVPSDGLGNAGEWGDYNCNLPVKTMNFYLQWVAKQNPDFILYSGDTPPHTQWDETIQSQQNCTEILLQSLGDYLSNFDIYPNIGNHEMYPTNLYSLGYIPLYTLPMNELFAYGWTPYSKFSEEQQATMLAGGYYGMVIRPGLRLVSFNSNYWYSFNWYTILNEGQPELIGMAQFLQQQFEMARNNSEKVLLMNHHPPGGGDAIVRYTRWFEDLLAAYHDLVVLHVSGHTHIDEYKVLTVDGTPLLVNLVAPSFTTKTDKNPSVRIFYLDSITYELLDYEQFHIDLLETYLKELPEPEIKLIYSAKTEYDLPNLSPSSWNSLTYRMSGNETLFNRYFWNMETRYKNETGCDTLCHTAILCKTLYYSFDQVYYCTGGSD